MKSEPVITTATATVTALIALLVALGLPISDELQVATLGVVAALAPLALILAPGRSSPPRTSSSPSRAPPSSPAKHPSSPPEPRCARPATCTTGTPTPWEDDAAYREARRRARQREHA